MRFIAITKMMPELMWWGLEVVDCSNVGDISSLVLLVTKTAQNTQNTRMPYSRRCTICLTQRSQNILIMDQKLFLFHLDMTLTLNNLDLDLLGKL